MSFFRYLRSKLYLRFVLATAALLTIVGGILLVGLYQNLYSGLLEENNSVHEFIVQATGVNSISDFKSSEAIKSELQSFAIRTSLVILGIVMIIIMGIMVVFYTTVGRHVLKLVEHDSSFGNGELRIFPESEIPRDEIGELIRARNKLVKELREYQDALNKKLDESKAQVVQSAKLSMVGEMTGTIAHDLRNPLTVISGYISQIQMMQESGKVNDKILVKAVDKITFALERINRLVDRMNRFNRVEVSMEDGVSLKETIDNSLVLVENKIRNLGCDLKLIENSERVTYWGDTGLLEQVIMNLLGNALDAMADLEKKELEIAYGTIGRRVFVRVTDTGTGISPENLSKLYQSFFTTKPAGKGTGLGLSVVYQIVQKHEGTIEVESELGYGTSFQITLNAKKPLVTSAYESNLSKVTLASDFDKSGALLRGQKDLDSRKKAA